MVYLCQKEGKLTSTLKTPAFAGSDLTPRCGARQFKWALFALAACACSNESSSSGQDMVKQVSCDSPLPYSEKIVGDIKIKLLEPNDPATPGIWQGPICFYTYAGECGLDISLIKGVEPGNVNYIIVKAFSGSVAHIYTVDPVVCKVIEYTAR